MHSPAASASDSDELHIDLTSSLTSYFHDELAQISKAHEFDVLEDTLWYLSTLLKNYSRSENFFDFNADNGITLTPLADYYRFSIEADTDRERRLHLQRLGDVSIFVAGLFSKALNRKAVDVSYYVAMGENAYGYLADTPSTNTRDRALETIYGDLASHFSKFTSLIGLLRTNAERHLPLINIEHSKKPDGIEIPPPHTSLSTLVTH